MDGLVNKKVVVALSGGVDSSVAALLLKKQGYKVIGITMKLWDYDQVGGNPKRESGCCTLDSFNDARAVCHLLGIPHYVLNFSEQFQQIIVRDFINEYLAGRTPNPCVQCNIKIKWKILLQKAEQLNADYIATGHYARIIRNKQTGLSELHKGLDRQKDQSYALWGIKQHNLTKTLFPLGDYTKDEVRNLARKNNLSTASKSESQEICFVADNDYHRLLVDKNPALADLKSGEMIDTRGKVIGKHKGYPFYTIGQRKGLGGGFSEPMYVVDIQADNNRIVVGNRDALYAREFIVDQVNIISGNQIEAPLTADVKIRYNDTGHPGTVIPVARNKVKIIFSKPQKAITPGQSAVFYQADRLIGGGIIEKKLN